MRFIIFFFLNPLTPNDPYRGRTAPLISKVALVVLLMMGHNEARNMLRYKFDNKHRISRILLVYLSSPYFHDARYTTFRTLQMFEVKNASHLWGGNGKTHSNVKMEHTKCAETSACKIQTPENYREENIQQMKIFFLCVADRAS